MRRVGKVQLFAFLVINLLLIGYLIFWSSRPTIPVNELPGQRIPIDSLVLTLKRETWDQSVEDLLTNGNQFLELGIGAEPLGSEAQLEQMLSARRAIKILNTIEALPANKRIQRCEELFDRVRRASEEMFNAAMLRRKQGTAREYEPLVTGHAVGLALFATAETGRRDILAKQFARLEEIGEYGPHVEARFQINVLRLAVSRDPSAPENLLDRIDAYCRSVSMITNEVTVVSWNARTTAFEELVGSAPDLSKGLKTYLFYDWSLQMTIDSGIHYEGGPDTRTLKREILRRVQEMAL